MPSPFPIGRKAPPGQDPIATRRLKTQVRLLLYSAGLFGWALFFAWSASRYVRNWIADGSPSGEILPVAWPAMFLIWGCFGIPRLLRRLATLKAEQLAERKSPSG